MDQVTTSAAPEARLHFLDYWRVIRIRKAIIITVFLITAIIATAVTLILPESYASTARIKVEGEGGIVPGMGNSPAATSFGYDPYFIQTTFEIMQSQLVLSNVIATMNLNVEWGKKYNNGDTLKTTETMEILKQRMGLTPVRNTKLISITVYSDDKKEAADLANTIAEAYQTFRIQTAKLQATTGLDVYQTQYLEESNRIETLQATVDNLRRTLDINNGTASSPEPELTVEQLRSYQAQKLESERTYNELLTQLQMLQAIQQTNQNKLRDVLPSVVADPALNSLLDQYHEAQRKIAALKIDYGITNFAVTRIQTLIDTLDGQINDRVAGLMAGIESQVGSKKASLDSLVQQVAEAKQKDHDNATKNQPYYEEKRKLDQLLDSHKLLYSKIVIDTIDAQIPKTTMVQIIDRAEPGKAPVKPNKTLNITLGLIFGLIMGVGLAFFIEYLDTSVKTIDDVERTFQAPVLGVIPQNIGYLLEEGAESKHAEAYRVLRTNLLFSRKGENLNTIVIVSAGAGEGKSTTTINLSTVFAQAGNRVLIVDSDLRRPTLHKLFKVANNLGLTNYLLKQNTVVEVVQTTSVPNLDFMASGKLPSSSMGILGSAQMKELIAELKQRYDFIFFDSPPILGVSDASILASEVDLVMQVIQYRRYPQPMTIRAKQMIEKVGGNFVGMVLNNINMSQDEGYYYYSGYYHDYYYSRSASEQEAEAKKADPAAKPPGDTGDTESNIKQKY
ncbi:MAG TPA: polysaccharide biosynthesis tyrosine autokinase [Candidatus Limnocylindrales bacterium]|nr:polysaccharide biosynthesis tyrosine autokinase [Candidatus Limnocylindrales bacterium]